MAKEFEYEYNPIKEQTGGKAAEKVIWSTSVILKALEGIQQGQPLKASPFLNKNTKLLKEYYKIESVDAILKRLPRRTRGAVIDKAMSLGLRNYTKLLVDWTNEQTSFLINNWEKMSDKQLAIALHKKQTAVRDKRYYLGLSRFANHYNKATYENLNKFLRGNTNSWKTRSMKECNYKCILTDSKDFAIHHL